MFCFIFFSVDSYEAFVFLNKFKYQKAENKAKEWNSNIFKT